MQVKVIEHRMEWKQMFEAESQRIKDIFGDELVDIHHIGSTSVKGLKAKPIIDIMPAVKNIEKVDLFNTCMENIGYECLGEFGIEGRRYFRKGGDQRTHQVHVFEIDNEKDINRHLALRDYLRDNPTEAGRYGELKQKLAESFPDDIERYVDGKDAFVKDLEQRALRSYGTI